MLDDFKHLEASITGGVNSPTLVDEWETITPIGNNLLIKPDPPKDRTQNGIYLPGSIRIPSFRGRVIEISPFIEQLYNQIDVPEQARIRPLDTIIFQFGAGQAESAEDMLHKRVLMPITAVMAIVRRS